MEVMTRLSVRPYGSEVELKPACGSPFGAQQKHDRRACINISISVDVPMEFPGCDFPYDELLAAVTKLKKQYFDLANSGVQNALANLNDSIERFRNEGEACSENKETLVLK